MKCQPPHERTLINSFFTIFIEHYEYLLDIDTFLAIKKIEDDF